MNLKKIILSIAMGVTLVACSQAPPEKSAVRPRFKGSKEEQIAYHAREVERFRECAVKEDRKALQCLEQNHLRGARECYGRKKHALSKADHHLGVLKSLNGEQA